MSNWAPDANPNSAHQRWSRWTFVVLLDARRIPTVDAVRLNFQRYCSRLFKSSAGRVNVAIVRDSRVRPIRTYAVHKVEIEGPPVHDPAYQAWVRREFEGVFMAQGFGPGATLMQMEAVLLAGSREDGQPATQLLVLPEGPTLAATPLPQGVTAPSRGDR
jgi:hypothetical protein